MKVGTVHARRMPTERMRHRMVASRRHVREVQAVAIDTEWKGTETSLRKKVGAGTGILLAGALGVFCARPLQLAGQAVLDMYQRTLVTHPVLNKSIVSMILFSASDLLAQFAVEKKKRVDLSRLLRMAAYASLVDAPLSHHWYQGLDLAMPASTGKNVFFKVALSQVVWEPIIVSVLVVSNMIMRLQPLTEWTGELKEKLVSTIKVSWRVWPAIHVVNFCYIPSSQRVAFCSLANLAWVAYLSVVANKRVEQTTKETLHTQAA